MSQMPLFAGSGQTVLVDDELGRVAYTPDFLAAETAQAWFIELSQSVPWQTQRRRMYDRDVDVPRLQAYFRLDEEDGAPETLRVAAGRVRAFPGVPSPGVGLTFSRDGRDSGAPHNAHLAEIVPGFPIVLLSLGAPRRMTIRAKQPPRRVLHVDLEAG